MIREILNKQPIARMGAPVRSWKSRVADTIQIPNSNIGYVKGGNVIAGLASGLKGYLAFKGAMEDSRNQQAYNDYLAQQAELANQQNANQFEEQKRLNYIKAGINPDRLNVEGYIEKAIEENRKRSADQVKGEFGYAMNVIQSPDFKKLPSNLQKLWMDFAATKAKGLENAYGQAFQTALGKGQGELVNAQEIARKKAIGSELLEQGANGELTPLKGSKEDVARTEKKEKYLQGMRSSLEKSDMMLDFIDKAIDLVQKNPMASGAGAFLAWNPYSDAGKLNSYLSTIKGNVGLKELINSKAEGATYGALSEKELQMLQDSLGKLEQGQSPEVLLQILNNVKNSYSGIRNRAMSALSGDKQQVSAEDLWNSIGRENAVR